MLGFTKQEQGIVLFLIFALLVGSAVGLYRRYTAEVELPGVDPEYLVAFQNRSAEIAETVDEAEENRVQTAGAAGIVGNVSSIPNTNSGVGVQPEIRAKTNDSSKKFLVNLNTANKQELQKLPRIGPVTAQKIIDFRQQNGVFASVEQLMQVKGIGKATLERVRPYVTIN